MFPPPRPPRAVLCPLMWFALLAYGPGMALVSAPDRPDSDLRWESTEHRVTAALGDTAVSATFAFRNEGSRPVRIAVLEPSCSCTSARLEPRLFAPGEGAAVEVVFTFGDRFGDQVETVLVETDEPGGPRQVLTLRAHLPEFVRIEPRALQWVVGQAPEARSVAFRFHPEAQARSLVLRTSADPADFTAALAPGPVAGQWVLTVTPADTSRSRRANFHLEASFDSRPPRAYAIFALVRFDPRVPRPAPEGS